MKHYRTLLAGVLASACIGCNSGEQRYSRQPTHAVPVVDNVRAWLNGVAQSGELDSGAEVMRSEIEKLREHTGINVDAVIAGFDELLKTSSPKARRTKAKDLEAKLSAVVP